MAALVSAHAVAYRIAKQRSITLGVMLPPSVSSSDVPPFARHQCNMRALRSADVVSQTRRQRGHQGIAPQCRKGPIASHGFMPNPSFVLEDELAALDPTRLSDY